jgi:murein DD-endopeptidase MepM/ murein hydrolase activator NlpD
VLRRFAGVWALAAALACCAAGPAGALGAGTAHTQLLAIQRDLDRVTFRIRVETAVWMALVRGVRSRQSLINHRPGSTPARARDELVVVLPAWVAVKRALHRDYREVKAILSRAARVTHRVPLERWRSAWPLRLRRGSTLGACPVQGPFSLADSFGAPRPGGRIHEGNDLFAVVGTPLVAVQPGVAVHDQNALGGRALILRSSRGYSYYGHFSRYGASGAVRTGDVVGFVGTSGDAKGLMPHVHFEYHPAGGAAVDPFPFLQAVC